MAGRHRSRWGPVAVDAYGVPGFGCLWAVLAVVLILSLLALVLIVKVW